MNSLEIFTLTLIEITGIMTVWSALETRLDKKYFKILFIILATALLTAVTDYFKLRIGIIINYAAIILLVKCAINISLISILCEFLLILGISFSFQFASVLVIRLLTIEALYSYRIGLIVNSIYLMFCIIIYLYIPIKKFLIEYEKFTIISFIIIINSAFYAFFLKWTWHFGVMGNSMMLSLLGGTLALNVLNIAFIRSAIKIQDKEHVIQTYSRYSSILSSLMDEVRCRQHDFKNHLHTIYGLTEISVEGDIRKNIQKYIQSLDTSLIPINSLLHLHNDAMSAIIYSKICQAKQLGIQFDYMLDPLIAVFPLEDYELSEILGNLLDNAFHATASIQTTLGHVQLRIGDEEGKSFIQVRNTSLPLSIQQIHKMLEKGFSTKKDHSGYGLYNVKKIVEEKNGTLQLSFDEGYIIFTILFQ